MQKDYIIFNNQTEVAEQTGILIHEYYSNNELLAEIKTRKNKQNNSIWDFGTQLDDDTYACDIPSKYFTKFSKGKSKVRLDLDKRKKVF